MAPKIVCVVGPTACGKTTLGVLLAKKFDVQNRRDILNLFVIKPSGCVICHPI